VRKTDVALFIKENEILCNTILSLIKKNS